MQLPRGEVLIFDVECRPTAWIAGDFVGKSMTAWAATYLDSDEVFSDVLTRKMTSVRGLVLPIAGLIESASLVIGHYIRGFDFPIVNGDLERAKDKPLPRCLTVDTKIDRIQGLGLSESLGNLAARYEIDHAKEPMTEPMWEEHNLWQTPRSVEWVRTRVEGDVVSTKELYLAMEAAGRLKAPKAWDPSNVKLPRYRG